MNAPGAVPAGQLPLPPQRPARAEQEQTLYEVRTKIYPRAVHGIFARWRVALVVATQLVFYGLPWLHWNDFRGASESPFK